MQSEDTGRDIGAGIGASLTYLVGIRGATLGADVVIVAAAVNNSRRVKQYIISININTG